MDEKAKKASEMQEVRIVVEHIHVYRYPKWRIRMPKVYIRAKPKGKKRGRWAHRLWREIGCAMVAMAVAFEVYVIMLPAVIRDHPGKAMGGECIVMAMAGLAAYWILHWALGGLDREKGGS